MLNKLIPIRLVTGKETPETARKDGLRLYRIAVDADREVLIESYVGPFSRPDRYDWTGLQALAPPDQEVLRIWLDRAIQKERREAAERRARRERERAKARADLKRMVSSEDLARLDEIAFLEHEARNRIRMRGGRAELPDHPHTRRWGLPLFQSFFGMDHTAGIAAFVSMNGQAREEVYGEFRRRLGRWESWRLREGRGADASHAPVFAVLGLSPQASSDQVKRRFRELAKRFHPDRSSGSEETMKKITAAYVRIVRWRRESRPKDAPSS